MVLLAAVLSLHVVLDEPVELRLASTGTGTQPVDWSLDGTLRASTDDARAATLALPAGTHVLWASSADEGAWRVLARPAQAGNGQASFVPAWTAAHAPERPEPAPLAPPLLALAALVVAFARGRSRHQEGDPGPIA